MAAQFDDDGDEIQPDEFLKDYLFNHIGAVNPEVRRIGKLLETELKAAFEGEAWGPRALNFLFEEKLLDFKAFMHALPEADQNKLLTLTGLIKFQEVKSLYDNVLPKIITLLQAEPINTPELEKLILDFIKTTKSIVSEMQASFKENRATVVAFIDQQLIRPTPEMLSAISNSIKHRVKKQSTSLSENIEELQGNIQKFSENNSLHALPEWKTIQEQVVALPQKIEEIHQKFQALQREFPLLNETTEIDVKNLQEYQNQALRFSQEITALQQQITPVKKQFREIKWGAEASLRRMQLTNQVTQAAQIVDMLGPTWQEADDIIREVKTIWKTLVLEDLTRMSDQAAFQAERADIEKKYTAEGWRSNSLLALHDMSKMEVVSRNEDTPSRAHELKIQIEKQFQTLQAGNRASFWESDQAFKELETLKYKLEEELKQSKEFLARTQALKQAVQVVGGQLDQRVEILKPLNQFLEPSGVTLSRTRPLLERLESLMEKTQKSAEDLKLTAELQETLGSYQAALTSIRTRFNRSAGYHQQLRRELLEENATDSVSAAQQARTRIEHALQDAKGDVERAQQLADEALGVLKSQVSDQVGNCEELSAYIRGYLEEVEALTPGIEETVRKAEEQLSIKKKERASIAREACQRGTGMLFSIANESEAVIPDISFGLKKLKKEIDEVVVDSSVYFEDDQALISEIKASLEPYQAALDSIRTRFERSSAYDAQLKSNLDEGVEGSIILRIISSVENAYRDTGGNALKIQEAIDQTLRVLAPEIAQQHTNHEELVTYLRTYLSELQDLEPKIQETVRQAKARLEERETQKYQLISDARDKIHSSFSKLDDISWESSYCVKKIQTALSLLELRIQAIRASGVKETDLEPYQAAARNLREKLTRGSGYHQELSSTILNTDNWDNGPSSLRDITNQNVNNAFREAKGDFERAQQIIDGSLKEAIARVAQTEPAYEELLTALKGYLQETEKLNETLQGQYPDVDLKQAVDLKEAENDLTARAVAIVHVADDDPFSDWTLPAEPLSPTLLHMAPGTHHAAAGSVKAAPPAQKPVLLKPKGGASDPD